MHSLWYLITWVTAHSRMAVLANQKVLWTHVEPEADAWAWALVKLDPRQLWR